MLSFVLRFSHSSPGDIVKSEKEICWLMWGAMEMIISERVWIRLATTLPMFVQVVVAQKASENSTVELALKM